MNTSKIIQAQSIWQKKDNETVLVHFNNVFGSLCDITTDMLKQKDFTIEQFLQQYDEKTRKGIIVTADGPANCLAGKTDVDSKHFVLYIPTSTVNIIDD